LWYHREFDTAGFTGGGRLLLHFEAVDHAATVWLNGVKVGEHRGGHTPFEFDVTKHVSYTGSNSLVVRVTDATGNFQPRGKQSQKPEWIWYTSVSGIWQTVWLEEVPENYITSLSINTSIEPKGCIEVQAATVSAAAAPSQDLQLRVKVADGDTTVSESRGAQSSGLSLTIDDAKLWSPESPHLYDLQIELLAADGSVLDSVLSYTGIRTIGKKKDSEGHWRITLNGKFVFHFGPLDQGWWPDGLLTPPSDEAMRSDIEFLKESGFNMIRKHVKVEPRRYYHHCDVIGIMVWQDQVSGTEKEGDYFNVPPWTRVEPCGQDADWPDWAKKQFRSEFKEMVDALHNHPAIAVWTPFNESWGQHDTMAIAEWLQGYDRSRLINIASGGNFFEVGDIVDQHNYPEAIFPVEDPRFRHYIKVVGEFGGHGMVLPEQHLWSGGEHWGYGDDKKMAKSVEELETKYNETLQSLLDLMPQGIAAGVYTQTTDVEFEVNGLISYDRKVKKLSSTFLMEAHKRMWEFAAGLPAVQ